MDFRPLRFCATTHINYDGAWTDQLRNFIEIPTEPHFSSLMSFAFITFNLSGNGTLALS
jgi:hypothetical protein